MMKFFWENVESKGTRRLGSLQCSKYNRVDFCLNSKLTPHFITKMNSSKISCIQQIKKNKKIKIKIKKMYTTDKQQHMTRERSHSQILQKRALRIPPTLIHKAVNTSSKLIGKIDVFISQTGKITP